MKKQQIVVCVIGPSNSGKGTQADLVASQLSGVRVTIGNLIRDTMQSDTALGRRVAGSIKNGTIIGTNIIKPVLDDVMFKQGDTVLVLDGFPRTVDQAKLFLGYASEKRYILAVELMLDDVTIKKRAMQRLTKRASTSRHEDTLSILDDKMLLYRLGNKQIRQVFVDGMLDGCNMNYFQTDGKRSVAEIGASIMDFIRKDLG